MEWRNSINNVKIDDAIATLHRVENVLSYLSREGTEMISKGDPNCSPSKDSIDHSLNGNSRYILNLY